MPRHGRMTLAILLTLGSLVALGPVAFAQNSPPSNGGAAGAEPGDESREGAERFPVFAVTSVEVMHSKTKPELSVIAVHGFASADGWTDLELIPLIKGTPPDAVLDLVLVGVAPEESSAPTGYVPVHAILPISEGHPFKAIRVRSATNTLLLRDLQGFTEARAPAAACSPCVGRYLVAKGDSAPAGVAADQVVRAEDLPPNSRVIRATDGIADVNRNPNRLTILLGEDNRIIDAVWE